MDCSVLMLSWEYPPEHVGGLGRHVCHLARELVKSKVNVTVLTKGSGGCKKERMDEGVRVVSFCPYDLHPPDFMAWALEFNIALLEKAVGSLEGDFDIIHAHDWMVGLSAKALKNIWNVPLVSTIHATEHGRQGGLHNSLQRHISEVEWNLCYESWRVIACSNYMRREMMAIFGLPQDKIKVIQNGIGPEWFQVERAPSQEPVILYVGRMVPEKGPQTAIEAMPEILRENKSAKLFMAGVGPMEDELKRRIANLGLEDRVFLMGMLGDKSLKKLYGNAHAAVFPSSYEPFGIVALEAMATGAPCVVGDTGGLAEIIRHNVTGKKVQPKNPSALATAVNSILKDKSLSERLSRNAKEEALTNYSWGDIAQRTKAVYAEVLEKSRHLVAQ